MLAVLTALALGLVQPAEAAGAAPSPASSQPARSEDVIVVRGRRTGPRLWRAYDEDTEIYVFVTVGWLPEDLEWDDTAIRSVLQDADLVITDFDIDAGALDNSRLIGSFLRTIVFNRGRLFMPRGTTLADKVGDDLAERFSAAMAAAELRGEQRRDRIRAARRDDDPETDPELEAARFAELEDSALAERLADFDPGRLHPFFQAAGLQSAAPESVGLEFIEVGREAARLARREGVPHEAIQVFDLAVRDITALLREARDFSEETNRICIEEALQVAEEDLPRLHTLAYAWAAGDAAALRAAAAEPRARRCVNQLETEIGALETLGGVRRDDIPVFEIWTERLLAEMERPGVRLAIIDSDFWLTPEDGVLDRLRAAGIEVAGP